jgi:hypothetical protein
MAIEAAVAEGAKKKIEIHPFAEVRTEAATTRPAAQPARVAPAERVVERDPGIVG